MVCYSWLLSLHLMKVGTVYSGVLDVANVYKDRLEYIKPQTLVKLVYL